MFGSGLLTNLQALNSSTMPPEEAVGMDVTTLGSMFSKCGTFRRHWTSLLGPHLVTAVAPHAGMNLTTIFNQGQGPEVQYSKEPFPGSTP